jgi:transposase-like protein
MGAGRAGGAEYNLALGGALCRRVQPSVASVRETSWQILALRRNIYKGWRAVDLYRAVDEVGRTVESYLSRTRDIAAARAFFRKALKRHGQPRTITLDGFEPSHAALRRMGMRNEFNYRWENPVKIRCCPYLNNIVEQDHRRVKSRIQPMLGFKKFSNARRVLVGIEFVQKILKGQFRIPTHFGRHFGSIWRTALAS